MPADIDFVALEQAELARWDEHGVFERSITQREGAPPWVFYEGPPTANGKPGLHHVWARVYKDLFCRFRTMAGTTWRRRAGWDTHGLPVEVEVEKQLGITGKQQIEEQVGIAEFTRLCRESVYSYVGDFARLTHRIGYWVDMDAAYWTLSPGYVESVWWHLQQLFDQGLLYEDLKVVPVLPALRHRAVEPRARPARRLPRRGGRVRLRPPAPGRPRPRRARRRRVAGRVDDHPVDAAVQHRRGRQPRSHLRRGRRARWWPRSSSRPCSARGAPPRADPGAGRRAGRPALRSGPSTTWPRRTAPTAGGVVPADYVTTEEGTGLVHLAPAFGEVDRQIGRANGLPSLNPVGPDGRFTAEVAWLAGRDVREANHDINDRLEAAGPPDPPLPLRALRTRTAGAAGRRSSTGASRAGTSPPRPARTTCWPPTRRSTGTRRHIKDGRFGEWLANNVDWALSRDRYWGTPAARSGAAAAATCAAWARWPSSPTWPAATCATIDPHRPTIDEVTFPCPTCAAEGPTTSCRWPGGWSR